MRFFAFFAPLAIAAVSVAQPARNTARDLADSAYAYTEVDPVKAMDFAQRALPLAKAANDLSAWHDALNTIRYVYFLRGEHARVIEFSAQALVVAERIGSERCIGDDHGWIAVSLSATGQVDEGFRKATIALEHMRRANDPVALARGLCDLSCCAVNANRFGEAIMRVCEAENIYEDLDDPSGMAFAQGLIADCYMKQGRYGNAMPYLMKAYGYVSVQGDDIEKLWLECDLVKATAHLNLLDKSEGYLAFAEAHIRSSGAIRERPALMRARMELLEKKGELAQALALSQQLIELTDSIAHAELNSQVVATSAAQQLAEARAEHERIAMNLDVIQRTEASRARSTFLWTLGAVLSALTVGVLVFALVRANRQKLSMQRALDQALDQVDVLNGHRLA